MLLYIKNVLKYIRFKCAKNRHLRIKMSHDSCGILTCLLISFPVSTRANLETAGRFRDWVALGGGWECRSS